MLIIQFVRPKVTKSCQPKRSILYWKSARTQRNWPSRRDLSNYIDTASFIIELLNLYNYIILGYSKIKYLFRSHIFAVLSLDADARKSPHECQLTLHTACRCSVKVCEQFCFSKFQILTVESPLLVASILPLQNITIIYNCLLFFDGENSWKKLPWMKVTAWYPISVAITSHDHLSVWYGPHLPWLIVASCYRDHFSRMNCNS